MRNLQKLLTVAFTLAPLALARSTGAPTQRAGVPSEGGLNCTACHRTNAVNSDPTGRLTIDAAPYTPGVKQKIRVSLTHPSAARWGFTLTPRLMSDETKAAGSLASAGDDTQIRCGAFPGGNEGCTADGVVQFATHTPAGTRAGTSGGSTWELEWTPPATSAGEIVFYAAGNAANNNNTNAGDNVYTTRLRIQPAAGCTFSAAPRVNAVVDSASFRPAVAFNGLISIFGTGLGPTGVKRIADSFDFRDSRFPKELGCMSVEVNGVDAPILYVDENQINAQAPALVVFSPVRVRVRQNKGRAVEARAEVDSVPAGEFMPAFFTFGSNSIAAQHADGTPVADASVVAGATAVKPGEMVTLYGTGFGVTAPVWQHGEVPSTAQVGLVKNPFTVQMGAATLSSADITYAGLYPGAVSGLYQFTVRVPDSAPDGNLPVTIRIGGAATQDGAFIPVKR